MSLTRTSLKRRSSLISRLSRSLFLLAATALAVAACGNRPVYSHYEHIDGDSWRRGDTITFTTIVRDSDNYHLTLGLRATNDYPYTQLTVNVDITSRLSPLTTHHSPLTFDITDSEGDMKGDGTTIRHYDMPLNDVVLCSNDTLTVSVYHAMSRYALPGITDVGLTVAGGQ